MVFTRADALAAGFVGSAAASVAAFGLTPWALAGPFAAFGALLADGIARPQSPWLMPVVTHGDRTRPAVALTFDDGPDPQITPAIADELANAGARATFFCIGRHLEAAPELARALFAAGHQLGNHSYEHARTLNFRGAAAQAAEIERGAAAVRAVTGQTIEPLYRPPVGLKNPPLARVVKQRGLQVIMWSLHGRDTGARTPEQIASRVLARVRPGDIVLLHDGADRPGVRRASTPAAVRLILRDLRERGLAAVTVDELRDTTFPAAADVTTVPAKFGDST